jgi:predicted phage terminase large subunit-like protein
VISVDFAHTSSSISDYTVYTAIGKDAKSPFNVFVLDSVRFKSEKIADKIDKLVDFYNDIISTYGHVKHIVFEDRDSQAERQSLNGLRPEIPTVAVKIRRQDKEARLDAFASYVQSGKVFFNLSMPLYNAMVGELLDFPSGKHDDICDTLSLVWLLPDWVNMYGQSGIVYIQEKNRVRI